MKDAVATMGNILPEDAGGRDAVHVAVFSAYADIQLHPSQHIGIVSPPNENGDTKVGVMKDGLIAIVDPFLPHPVKAGERFWAYLYPRTITALSHKWSHPSFETTDTVYTNPAAKLASEIWLKEYCESNDCPDYDTMIDIASQMGDGRTRGMFKETDGWYDGVSWSVDSDYLILNGMDGHAEIPVEFWKHAEIVVGKSIKMRPEYFSCSC